MVKVCHMTSVHSRYDVRIFQKECLSLVKAGFDVYLVVNDDKKDEVKDGVTISSSHYRSRNRIERIIVSVFKVYNEAIKTDADIYHFHDPELMVIAKRLKRKGKLVIFDSHEITSKQIEYKQYLPKILRKLISLIYSKYETHILKYIDAVVVPCTYNGKSYFGAKCKREVLINNLPKLDEVYSKDYCYTNREIQACYVGSLTAERGIAQIAEAADRGGITLILAGKFTPLEFKDRIIRKDHSIIKYLGELSRDQVKDILDKSYIGLCMIQDAGQYKYVDNLPTKVYEYMGAGIPVLVSDFPYYSKMMEKYKCGICVKPDSIDEIVEGMNWLIENPDRAEEMGKNGRRAVFKMLNWEKEEEKLIELYNELSSEICLQ